MLYSDAKRSSTTIFMNYKYIIDSGQTVISGVDQSGNLLEIDSDKYQVFMNGFRIINNEDYVVDVENDTLTLISLPSPLDEVIISTIKDKIV